MSAGAWVMFTIGAVGLWGGLAYFLAVALRASRKNRRDRAG
jgi:hypothetical protein